MAPVVAMAVAGRQNSAVSSAGQQAAVTEATFAKMKTGTFASHVKSALTKNSARMETVMQDAKMLPEPERKQVNAVSNY